jgi:hypothetical protein
MMAQAKANLRAIPGVLTEAAPDAGLHPFRARHQPRATERFLLWGRSFSLGPELGLPPRRPIVRPRRQVLTPLTAPLWVVSTLLRTALS